MQNNIAKPQTTRPVHIHHGNLCCRGPKGEEEGNCSVHKTKYVGQDSPPTELPWSVSDGLIEFTAPKDQSDRYDV